MDQAIPFSDDIRDYLTAAELAAGAGISIATVWRLKLGGKIPFYQPGGGRHFVRFPPNAIEQLKTDGATDNNHSQQLNDEQSKGARPAEESLVRNHLSGTPPKWMQ
jgi:hypothetical protein